MNMSASVMLSRFAPLRIALSEAKGLTVNSAKHPSAAPARHSGEILRCAQDDNRPPDSRCTLLALLLCVLASSLLQAATAAVVPTGDNSTGSWTTAPLWSSVDDDIDSPDGTVITSGNNPSTPTNDVIFNVTCPSDVGTITEASLRIRAREQGSSSRTISFAVSWSATVSTDFSTGALTSSLSNYSSGNKTGLSISKSTCDSSTFKVAPTTSGSGPAEKAEIDSFNLDITYTVAANQPPLRRTITLN